MDFSGSRLLFLGAHPDDIELGCGALLAHLAGRAEMWCVTLSDNQKNPRLTQLVAEHRRSMERLGVPRAQVQLGPFETRQFPRDRQQVLEFLYEWNEKLRPDVVFAHTRSDIHQDHAVVTAEALRAFRGTTLLGFDVLRSSEGFFPNLLIEVSELDVEKKLAALKEYSTYTGRYYFDPTVLRATLVRHGALAERPYAEGFEILRAIGRFVPPSASG